LRSATGNFITATKRGWIDAAVSAEALGCDTFLMPDHFRQQFASVLALLALLALLAAAIAISCMRTASRLLSYLSAHYQPALPAFHHSRLVVSGQC
jgi:hypothetical protein